MAIISLKNSNLFNTAKGFAFQKATGAVPVVPVPTFTSATTTSYTIAITGYDAQFTYTVSASAGTAVRTGSNVTVSGISANQSSTLTVTAANPDASKGISLSSSSAFVSLPATPTLSRSGGTTTTVTVAIGNYDAGLTYTIGSTVGSATRSGSTITVTGLTQGQAVTVTATASNASGNSAQGSLATGAVPATPTLSFSSSTETTATFSITNYNAAYTYSVSSSSGSASRSGSTITVTGLAESTSVTAFATATANGVASAQGSASATTAPATPTLSVASTTSSSVTVTITNYNAAYTYSVSASAGSASRSGNTITVTGLSESTTYSVFATAIANSINSAQGSVSATTTASNWITALITDQGSSFRDVSINSNNEFSTVGRYGNEYLFTTISSAGQTSSQRSYNTGADSNLTRVAASGTDAGIAGRAQVSSQTGGVLIKVNSSGVVQWQRTMGFNNVNDVTGVDSDSSGNFYVSSWSRSPSPNFLSRAHIFKYNSSGTNQWYTTLGQDGVNGVFNSVKVGSDGNIYAAGSAYGDGSAKGLVAKYDSSGNLLWQRTYLYAYFKDIDLDSSGNIYVVGQEGLIAFIVSYNTNGNVRWGRGNYFDSGGASFDSISISPNNQIFAAGSGIRFGQYKGVVERYNTSGSLIWSRFLGNGSTSVFLYGIDATNSYFSAVGSIGFSSGEPISIKFPTDGSKTGSYLTTGSEQVIWEASSNRSNLDNSNLGGATSTYSTTQRTINLATSSYTETARSFSATVTVV